MYTALIARIKKGRATKCKCVVGGRTGRGGGGVTPSSKLEMGRGGNEGAGVRWKRRRKVKGKVRTLKDANTHTHAHK